MNNGEKTMKNQLSFLVKKTDLLQWEEQLYLLINSIVPEIEGTTHHYWKDLRGQIRSLLKSFGHGNGCGYEGKNGTVHFNWSKYSTTMNSSISSNKEEEMLFLNINIFPED